MHATVAWCHAHDHQRHPAPTACRCTASASTGTRAITSSSRSTPARAPSAPRRTAWRTSSSTSSSRAARSSTTTARSTRRPSAWAASLNAYTSHDLVAFHITVRAEAAMEAIDLLTDFVGPPAARRRRARPRARRRHPGDPALQGPAVGRRRAADRPRRVRRPPARAARSSGPRSTCATFTRDAIVAFRERRWAGARGGAFIVGNLDHVAGERRRRRALRAASRRCPSPAPYEPAPALHAATRSSRSATRTSRTCG